MVNQKFELAIHCLFHVCEEECGGLDIFLDILNMCVYRGTKGKWGTGELYFIYKEICCTHTHTSKHKKKKKKKREE